MTDDDLGHADIEAALEARRELGARYDAELVAGFADRIERTVERRVADHAALEPARTGDVNGGRVRQFVLGVISLGVGVPVTIVPMVASDNGLPAVVVAWLGIVGVNAAHAAAVSGHRRRER